MSYYSRKIKKIKKVLKKIEYPPRFNPKKWRFLKLNCYAYALDIRVSDNKQKLYCPGYISGKNPKMEIWKNVSEMVEKDFEFLGISYRDDDGKLYNGEYRIALYYIPRTHDLPLDYHFVRQDSNGEWSEKPSWKAKIQKIGEKGDCPPDLSKYGPRLERVLIIKK